MSESDWKSYNGVLATSAAHALSIAAANSELREMQQLIDAGLDVNAKCEGTFSRTALGTAAGHGLVRAVDLLLSNAARLDITDFNDMTPLMCACNFGKVKGSRVALRLIEAGADVSFTRSSDGMTSLKFAAESCKPEVIQALIDHGADVDGPSNTDQTALMLAVRANHVPAIAVLVENGADLNRQCKLKWAQNRTALGLAIMEKRRKAIAYLESLT